MENTISLIIQLSEKAALTVQVCIHYSEPNEFNMLCIPPYNKNNVTSKIVYVKALEYCKARRAILLLDSPNKWTPNTKMDREFDDLRSPNAALFFPRIKDSRLNERT